MDSRIKLRHPWFSALLSFLVPGLGQAYQGRLFKALLYFFCIGGLFLTGARLAEWNAIQAPPFEYRDKGRGLLLLKYAAQFGLGTPAIGALLQTRRYLERSNEAPITIPAAFSAPFQGTLSHSDPTNGHTERHVSGTITLEPFEAPFGESIAGSFHGTANDGQQIDIKLDHHVSVDRPIDPSPRRNVHAKVIGQDSGSLDGSIPRRWQDWLGVPMDDRADQALQGRLGKWHELAMVLTWIAGLLNILAIWDALEGPAWGYNDQSEPGSSNVVVVPAARTPVRSPAAVT